MLSTRIQNSHTWLMSKSASEWWLTPLSLRAFWPENASRRPGAGSSLPRVHIQEWSRDPREQLAIMGSLVALAVITLWPTGSIWSSILWLDSHAVGQSLRSGYTLRWSGSFSNTHRTSGSW